ncbi:MAG: DUF202 domain-containing protein [Gammaproteobacteria bacterium]|nr:DUF202 domain-containing protein [Gammaproteobacteria bacterium]
MINHYRDHAANERTFLAWVRTGITVMMLGFLVEKFDIFLAAIAVETHGMEGALPHGNGSWLVSLSLVCLGIVMNVCAALRFFRTGLELEGEAPARFRSRVLGIGLPSSMVLFGLYLLAYLTRIL